MPLNAYFTAMLGAKRRGAAQFQYRGSTYTRGTTPSGLVVYKKGPVVYRSGAEEVVDVNRVTAAEEFIKKIKKSEQSFNVITRISNYDLKGIQNDIVKRLIEEYKSLDEANKTAVTQWANQIKDSDRHLERESRPKREDYFGGGSDPSPYLLFSDIPAGKRTVT